MLQWKAWLGLAVVAAAFGCGSSKSSDLEERTGAGGHAGSGSIPSGQGGSIPSGGSGGAGTTGAAGSGAAGAAGTRGGAGTTGAAGSGAAGSAGTSAAGTTGAAGSGAAGAAGTGGGGACAGDPLTRCTGTMSGPWCVETVPGAGPSPFFGDLWANRPDDVWWVGGQPEPYGYYGDGTATIAHFDGCTWTITPYPDLPVLRNVWGAAPNDVWMGGDRGSAYHWDGATLTEFPVPGAIFFTSLSGTSSTDVWATVGFGIPGSGIFHWNGGAWTSSFASGGFDVWAVAPTDVWAVSGLDALHFDGMTWTATPVSDLGLSSIWGDGTQAYAVGRGETIFRFAGGAWTTLKGPGDPIQTFFEIGGLGADIFTLGASQVVRLSGATFMPVPDAPSSTSFRTVWVSPTQIWLGAENGFVARRPR